MDLVIRAPRRPLLGETLMGSSFGTTGGGKGANQALACARLGAESHMIGCIGDDDFGVRLRATLTESKVDCEYLEVRSDVGTGVAVIMVTDSGDNMIVLAPGANSRVNASLIERAGDVFKKADAVMFQLEIPIDAVGAGLRLAHRSGCRTVLTPAPAQSIPPELWPFIDCLVLNETELAFYAQGGDSEEEVLAAARQILEWGTRGVVVTRGARGGVVVTKNRTFAYAPFSIEAVDSTGAGDSFCAALIVGLTEGMSLENAVRYASAAGALACTRFGAYPSMPWRHEVEALLERDALSEKR
jgi:ribokinase